MSKGKDILRRYDRLKGERSNFDTLWQEIGEYVLPNKADFNRKFEKGAKRHQKVFDSTPELSLDIFASSLIGIVANPASEWFSLLTQDEEINKDHDVRLWFDLAQKTTLNAFNEPEAKFYGYLKSALQSIGSFGCAGIGAYKGRFTRVRFELELPNQMVIAENEDGNVDTVIKEFDFRLEHLQSKEKNEGWTLTEDMKKSKNPDAKYCVVHGVYPNPEYNPANEASKRYSSCWIDKKSGEILFESGYEEFPIPVGRWDRANGEVWGRSPAMLARADIRTLNAMRRAHIAAAEKIINPPLQMKSEGQYNYPIDVSAGAVNIYQDKDGKIEPINVIGSINFTFEMEEQLRNNVRSAFYVDQLQLVGGANMTATEVMQRIDEKARLLAPAIGMIQAELIGPLVQRVLNILIREGYIPPPPPIITKKDIKVVYNSPITRAQRAQDAQSILTFLGNIVQGAAAFPEMLQKIDSDKVVNELHEMSGAPTSILRNDKDLAKMRKAQAQQAEAQQMAGMMEQGANIAKTAKEAGII